MTGTAEKELLKVTFYGSTHSTATGICQQKVELLAYGNTECKVKT